MFIGFIEFDGFVGFIGFKPPSVLGDVAQFLQFSFLNVKRKGKEAQSNFIASVWSFSAAIES
jgi:hypothetical protein